MFTTALIVSVALAAGPAQVKPEAAKAYAELLGRHVKNGRVDYKGLGDKDLRKLDGYLDAVDEAKVPADRLQAIAFYVDAYNALVLRSVIKHGRPRSVLDVKDFFDEKIHRVAGKTVSLNQLEKEVLNPFAKDPRTHMVLVCGAVGCPILDPAPYTGSDVDARLDAAAQRYLAGPTGAVAKEGAVELSKIFDWYARDFGGENGVVAFVKRFLAPEASARVGAAPKVSFFDYNWTLNQQ